MSTVGDVCVDENGFPCAPEDVNLSHLPVKVLYYSVNILL